MGEYDAKILTVSDEGYHSDPCEVPSLSASIGKWLIECPSKAWLYHPRLGGKQMARTKAMDAGALIDEILTVGHERISVITSAVDAKGKTTAYPKNYRLKDTQEQAVAIRAEGMIPCLAHELAAAEECANAVARKADAMGRPINGTKQFAVQWWETADNGERVLCRCKMDIFHENGRIQDLKRLASVSRGGCKNAIRSFSYDLQGAAYRSAVRALYPELAGRETFELVCFEESEPWPLTFVEHRGSLAELGDMKWRRAVNRWAELIKRPPPWPDYFEAPITIEASQWDLEDEYFLQGEKAA